MWIFCVRKLGSSYYISSPAGGAMVVYDSDLVEISITKKN